MSDIVDQLELFGVFQNSFVQKNNLFNSFEVYFFIKFDMTEIFRANSIAYTTLLDFDFDHRFLCSVEMNYSFFVAMPYAFTQIVYTKHKMTPFKCIPVYI